jgi:peptidoglycan-associated lipoprotein
MMKRHTTLRLVMVALLLVAVAACAKQQPPVARPAPPPATGATGVPTPPLPPEPVSEPVPVPPMPEEDEIGTRSLDDLNRDSPLRPVFFLYDASEVTPEAQAALQANAALLRKYPTWQITIEGHCDERGTAEYNLALGERRAATARDYLISLGISADRLRMVSYGKEFPFEPGSNEGAWAKNRRAHFVITAR